MYCYIINVISSVIIMMIHNVTMIRSLCPVVIYALTCVAIRRSRAERRNRCTCQNMFSHCKPCVF